MAYSRWSNSIWYTFWSAFGEEAYPIKWPTKKTKRRQVFEICDFPSYYLTYGDLEDKGINRIILDIRKFYKQSHDGQMFSHWEELEDGHKNPVYQDVVYPAKNPTEEEILELMGYIREWQEDIDKHFKFWNFIKWEWYYPLRGKIYRYFKKNKL